MASTKIEYCDETANFVTGCLHSCDYCYARRMATRLAGIKGTVYHRLRQAGCGPFDPAFHCEVFRKFSRRLENVKTSRRVFIASMGDVGCKAFFHSTGVNSGMNTVLRHNLPTSEVLQRIFELCTSQSRHTFLLLSKNPKMFNGFVWPDNVYAGTSFDRTNQIALSRLSALSEIRAGVRWVSVEPLLDPAFDVERLAVGDFKPGWVVVGGLSGKKPLPKGCDIAAERIVLWCKHHGIPVFLKDNLRLSIESPHEYP